MMALRGAVGSLIVFLTALAAPAQSQPRPPAPPASLNSLDQPTQYPPLLRPPASPDPPLAEVPRGPTGEYDHGYVYLPEYVPPCAPEACRPLGRWWISPSFEFAWLPARPAPTNIRLRVPAPGGGTIPGPVLPIAGQSADTFQAGFGLTGGWWFNDRNTCGVEASLFTLSGGDRTIDGIAPGMLVLFPDGAGSTPEVLLFPPGFPITGIFPVTLSTWFIGADVNYRHNLHCGPSTRLDLLAGYRFAYLEDEMFLGEAPDGSSTDYRYNRIAVMNPFHGGQVGFAGEYRGERWYLSGAAKVAFGVVSPEVCASGLFRNTEGFTGLERFAPAGPRRGLGNGGYTGLTAAGDGDDRFAVLPSLNLQLGRQVGQHARLYVAYSFQYLSEVARLGDVLKPGVAGLKYTDFWVQSLGLGFELRY
jgi:putative beta barrel porin BBP7